VVLLVLFASLTCFIYSNVGYVDPLALAWSSDTF